MMAVIGAEELFRVEWVQEIIFLKNAAGSQLRDVAIIHILLLLPERAKFSCSPHVDPSATCLVLVWVVYANFHLNEKNQNLKTVGNGAGSN